MEKVIVKTDQPIRIIDEDLEQLRIDLEQSQKLKSEIQLNDLIYVVIQDHYTGFGGNLFPSYVHIIGRLLDKFNGLWNIDLWVTEFKDERGVEYINIMESPSFTIMENCIAYLQKIDNL